LRIYRDFCDFQHGGCRHLEFLKIGNFNAFSGVGGQYATSRQISSKSVKRLRDMAIYRFSKWRPSAILDLLNTNFLMVGALKRPILHQRTKFRKDRSNRCGDIAFFVIFKMADAAILNFQKFKILTVDPL